jgi:CheY-like chemotaxis protein
VKENHPILLIEDDLVDSMTVKRAMMELGSRRPIHHVTDGEKALAFINDTCSPRPGLILLDLNMPRMNGIEFLQALKSDPVNRRIPVVILTTSREDRDIYAAYDRGGAGYFAKPAEYERFVEILRTILDYWSLCESSTATE